MGKNHKFLSICTTITNVSRKTRSTEKSRSQFFGEILSQKLSCIKEIHLYLLRIR